MKLLGFLTRPLVLLTLLATLGCQNDSKHSGAGRDRISVMTFNVENLFDTTPDADREDYTYLPLAVKKTIPGHAEICKKMGNKNFVEECNQLDWNESVLNTKLTRIANTILTVNGKGPDILLVQEVENQNVLDILNQKHLAAAKYQTSVLIEGEDKRGIDVGVLSRFPLAEPAKLHLIEFTPPPPKEGQDSKEVAQEFKRPLTRGIMEVPLLLPTGETLYVFTFHFPSQSNISWQRRNAVDMMNKLIKAKGPGALVIAGGDCNITASEDREHKYISDILSSQWTVSHLAGCKDCLGTEAYFEKDKKTGKVTLSWSFFDILLFSPSLNDGKSGYKLDAESIRVQNTGLFQKRVDPDSNGAYVPSRFDITNNTGVSDHWPMYAELVRQ